MPRTVSDTVYLKTACERCGGHIEYPSELGGQSIQCPHCKHEITLPASPIPPPPVQQPAGSSIKKASSASQKKPRHNFRNDPATEAQKNVLKRIGIAIKEGLTKGEASELIDHAKAEPVDFETEEKIRKAKYEEQRRFQPQYPSYHLKELIAEAAKDLQETKKEKREAKALLTKKNKNLAAAQQKRATTTDGPEQIKLDLEIMDVESEVGEAEETFDVIDVGEAKDELRYESRLRIKFWKATFPSGGGSLTMDDWEGLADYEETIDRYSEFGCRFEVPSDKQISDVLAALDRDAPAWDKTEPERFYSALAAAFPDLTRKEHGRQYAGPQRAGCLVIIGATIASYLLRHFKLLDLH
jgi:DNA-directed RNA polymerase subunit RPC12/RpoP